MIMTLLLERLHNTAQCQGAGLFVLNSLLLIQHQDATIGDLLSHLLPGWRISQPEPWHRTLADRLHSGREESAALTLQQLHALLLFLLLSLTLLILGSVLAA